MEASTRSTPAPCALTDCTTVLPTGDDIDTIVGERGRTYILDARDGRCSRPGAEYNLETARRANHELRPLVAIGRRSVPAWVDRDTVDGLLGHPSTARLVATDGGEVFPADVDDGPDPARSVPPAVRVPATIARRSRAGIATPRDSTSRPLTPDSGVIPGENPINCIQKTIQ